MADLKSGGGATRTTKGVPVGELDSRRGGPDSSGGTRPAERAMPGVAGGAADNNKAGAAGAAPAVDSNGGAAKAPSGREGKRQRSRLLKGLWWFTFHKNFTLFINVLIFANLVTLTMQAEKPSAQATDILWGVDIFFNVAFTVEMILKICCMGFFNWSGYLSEPWNRLDFFIVVMSWATFNPTLPSSRDPGAAGAGGLKALRAIRAVRALRAFKALSFLKNVNMIMRAVGSSLGMMAPILSFSLFFVVIFGVAGVQFFSGRLHKRCANATEIARVPDCVANYTADTLYMAPGGSAAENQVLIGTPNYKDTSLYSSPRCELAARLAMNASALTVDQPDQPCADPLHDTGGTGGYVCPPEFACVSLADNPNWGFDNFDNFGYAFLVIFQVTSLEGWTGILYNVMDGGAAVIFAIIYFLFLIFFMVFLILNFFVAVLSAAYGNARDEMEEEDRQKREDEEARKHHMDEDHHRHRHPGPPAPSNTAGGSSSGGSSSSSSSTGRSGGETTEEKLERTQSEKRRSQARTVRASIAGLSPEDQALLAAARARTHAYHAGLPGQPETVEERVEQMERLDQEAAASSGKTTKRLVACLQAIGAKCSTLQKAQGPKRFFQLVMHPYFNGFIMFCIAANTVTLMLVHYDINFAAVGEGHDGMYAPFKSGLDVCEDIFNVIFLVEMILKLIGLTPPRYFLSLPNCFDAFIVVTGTTTMLMGWLGTGGIGSFGMLRAFRLLRIVRLLTMLVEVQKLINTVFGSIEPVVNLFFLVAFSMYIFSIIGSMIFMGTFKEEDVGRQNFNGVGASFLALFVVLSGENWVDIWHEGMQSDVVLGIIFFIVYFIWISYVMLNLFIAVILENFETQEEQKYAQQQHDHFEQMWTKLGGVRLTRAAGQIVWLNFNARSDNPGDNTTLPAADLIPLLLEVQRAYGYAPMLPDGFTVDLMGEMDPDNTGWIAWEEFEAFLRCWAKGSPKKYRNTQSLVSMKTTARSRRAIKFKPKKRRSTGSVHPSTSRTTQKPFCVRLFRRCRRDLRGETGGDDDGRARRARRRTRGESWRRRPVVVVVVVVVNGPRCGGRRRSCTRRGGSDRQPRRPARQRSTPCGRSGCRGCGRHDWRRPGDHGRRRRRRRHRAGDCGRRGQGLRGAAPARPRAGRRRGDGGDQRQLEG